MGCAVGAWSVGIHDFFACVEKSMLLRPVANICGFL